MFRLSPRLAGAAVLVLFAMLPAFAQYLPLHKGVPPAPCAVGPYYYNKKGEPVPVYDPTERHLMRRADTGAARSALSFKPDSVRVERGQPIVFNPGIGWPAGRLTGDLYAIYSAAGAAKHDKYLAPVAESGLPSGSGQINAVINPLNYYEHDGSGPKPAAETPIPGTIVRLSNGRLDTTNMDYGSYWFTLQSAIDYGSGGTCHKTSSIVLIEIVEPPVDPKIKVDVTATDGYCEQKTYPHATAKLTLQDIQERDVKLSWNVTHSKGGNVTWEPYGNTKSVRVTNPTPGTYTFTATAESKNDSQIKDKASDTADYIGCTSLTEEAALVYFQFEAPDEKKRHLRPNPNRPEEWTRGYPTQHLGYYEDPGPRPGVPVETNTDALERIIERIKKDKSLYLRIYGYADYKKTTCYDNWALGERRARMVYNYIISRLNGDEGKRVSMGVVETRGDSSAQSRDRNDQADLRRWDRRAEIYYTLDETILPPVVNPGPPCSTNRRR